MKHGWWTAHPTSELNRDGNGGWGFPGSRPLEQRLVLAAAGQEAVIESTWCACWTRFRGAR